jgi:hypothetical protein
MIFVLMTVGVGLNVAMVRRVKICVELNMAHMVSSVKIDVKLNVVMARRWKIGVELNEAMVEE